jgi:hypothetical protein
MPGGRDAAMRPAGISHLGRAESADGAKRLVPGWGMPLVGAAARFCTRPIRAGPRGGRDAAMRLAGILTWAGRRARTGRKPGDGRRRSRSLIAGRRLRAFHGD